MKAASSQFFWSHVHGLDGPFVFWVSRLLHSAFFGCFLENWRKENYQVGRLLSFWFLAKPIEKFGQQQTGI